MVTIETARAWFYRRKDGVFRASLHGAPFGTVLRSVIVR
jgi:hypothetical protein